MILTAQGNPKMANRPRIQRRELCHFGSSAPAVHYIAGIADASCSATFSMSANTMFVFPVKSPCVWSKITELAIRVTAVNQNIRLGVWKNAEQSMSDASGEIYGLGKLMYDSGAVNVNAGGLIVHTIAGGSEPVLEPNQVYWVGVVGDGAITVSGVNTDAQADYDGMLYPSSVPVYGFGGTFTYAALIDAPSPFVVNTSTQFPCVRYRLASATDPAPGKKKANMDVRIFRDLPSHIGTSIGAVDYVAGMRKCAAFTTVAMALDTLRAFPFWSPPRAAGLSRLACEVTSGNAAGRKVRLALYENVADPTDIYPGALVADSGDLDASTTGIKSGTPSFTFKPNTLYWIAINGNNASVNVRAVPVASIDPILGADAAVNQWPAITCYYTVGSTYGTPPSTFPGSATYAVNSILPAMRYGFSS